MSLNIKHWRQDKSIGNFGDALSLVYQELMFTEQSRFSLGDVFLVGSVIEPQRINAACTDGFAPGDGQGQAIFWGCGMQNANPLPPQLQRRSHFLGVRGVGTRDALDLPRSSTPLGDTALLLPKFYKPSHHAGTAGKVLWIPHFRHAPPTAQELEGSPDPVVLSPAIKNSVEACLTFIDAIASARFVMANAMHAAIVALAYGTPFAFWGGKTVNYPFKWGDFTSGVGFRMEFSPTYEEGVRSFEKERPDRAFAAYDPQPLLEVAPFQTKTPIA